MFDLHRHDEFSFYDSSGKAAELAGIAKENKRIDTINEIKCTKDWKS